MGRPVLNPFAGKEFAKKERYRVGREMGRASGRLQNSSDLRSSRLVFKMSQFKLALLVIILFRRERLELQADRLGLQFWFCWLLPTLPMASHLSCLTSVFSSVKWRIESTNLIV